MTPKLGWVGWGVAGFGSLLSYFGKLDASSATRGSALPPPNVVADLDRLVRLRDRGDITEEQYLRQRNALLGDPGGKTPPAD